MKITYDPPPVPLGPLARVIDRVIEALLAALAVLLVR
jgi:hypothetical protein